MKVLVTGINGLLGSHVAEQLQNSGFIIRALVRKESDLRSIANINLELIYGQITKKTDIENAVQGVDYVIHVAALTSQHSSSIDSYRSVNIESTRFILKACDKWKIRKMIFISTANCFGNGTKITPGNEEKPFLLWLKNSGYAYSKFLAQKMVLE